MSNHTTEGQGPELPHDDDLARLYRQLPADQPSPEIDRAILDAARTVRPRRGAVLRMRWALPIAAAAGVVLMLTLTRLTPELQSPEWIERDALREETTSAELRADAKDAEEAMSARSAKNVRDTELAAKKEDVPAQAAKAASRASLRERGDSVGASPIAKAKIAQPASPAEQPPVAAVVAPPNQPMRSLGSIDETSPAAPGPSAESSVSTKLGSAKTASPELSQHRDEGRDEGRDAQGESKRQGEQVWPFALEAGMGSEEACHRMSEKLRVPCAFAGGQAELPTPAATLVDRGIWRGRVVTKVILHAQSGALIDVELELTTPQNQTERVRAASPP